METLPTCLFETIFQKSSTPAIIVKADLLEYTIANCNESLRLLMRGADITGKSIDAFLNSEEISANVITRFRLGLEKAVHNNEVVKISSFRFKSQSENQNNWWEIEIVPVAGSEQQPEQFLLNLHNITNRLIEAEGGQREQLLAEELAATNEELIIINEELTQSKESLQELNSHLERRVAARTKDLEESESRFRNMMENMPQMAWTSSPKGIIDFYNQQWHTYTGLGLQTTETAEWKWYEYDSTTFEHRQPAGWHKIIHPDDLEETLRAYENIIRSGKGGEFETRFKQTNNQYRWHLNRLVPFKNSEGKLVQWVGTATDIENLKVLQQQKDDFISIASHELKTPITTLKASLQLMKRMKSNGASGIVGDLIDKANNSMQRISILIEDLLNASKYNHGHVELHKKEFVLAEEIDECCRLVKEEDRKRIKFKGDRHLTVHADVERIGQVVINLINNAIKYAPQSEEIIVDVQKENELVKVSVADHGPGIPPEKQPFLFERYYRADASCIQYSGLGLGLYISAEIIKNHSGKIGVNSELGKGSAFWFTLPLMEAS